MPVFALRRGQSSSFRKNLLTFNVGANRVVLVYLLAAPPSAESWLPVSLGVLIDLEGDTGVGTKQ